MFAEPKPIEPIPPPIRLSRSQHCRLLHLAVGNLLLQPREAGALLQELNRAEVVPHEALSTLTAGLGSAVTFEIGGVEHVATLVERALPGGTNAEVSVLSNLGAGLLGLTAGQTIDWPDRVGGRRRLTVLAVSGPERPEEPSEAPAPVKAPAPLPVAPGEVVPFRRRTTQPPAGVDPPPSAA